MKKNFTRILLASAAMATIGLSYATTNGLLALEAEEEEEVLELQINPVLVNGEEEFALNTHSNVTVTKAQSLVVNFENGAAIKYSTYALDRVLGENEFESMASGALSINSVGFAEFDETLEFVTGSQYVLTVKAWDRPLDELFDENYHVADPLAKATFTFNGGSGNGIIGEPVFGIDRAEFPEDMISLGVPVRFPDMLLPYGVAAEDCKITVSASLYGVPTGNVPMPLDLDDDIDPGMGVDGPVCIEEAKIFDAYVEGGVVTAMLFPEVMEEGNTYAIQLNAVTVMDGEEIVAELPEDADYSTSFTVVPCVAVATLGEPVWGVEEGVITEDQCNLGVQVSFPDAVLPEGVNPMDLNIEISAMLYGVMPKGAEGGIMPLSEADDEEIDPGFTNSLVPLVEEPVVYTANMEGGVINAYLFAEEFAVGNEYVLVLTNVEVKNGEEVVLSMPEETVWMTQFVVNELEEAAEVAPEFIVGEETVVLNDHSAVSVETAEALAVKFVNAPGVRAAYYAIDRVIDEESFAPVASGELSLSQVGYVEFAKPLVFVSGQQYILTVKGYATTEVLDENLTPVEPLIEQVFNFNGASATGIVGEPVFGLELGEDFPEDMCNLGLKVTFPDMVLPFGVIAEDAKIEVSASLYGIPSGNEPMPLDLDDEVDPGMGVDGPVALDEAHIFRADVVGGIVTVYLFPEVMEANTRYAIQLNAVTVTSAEDEVVAELEDAGAYGIEFSVAPYVAPMTFGQIVWLGVDENGTVDVEEANINGVVAAWPFADFGTEDAVISVFATLYDVTNMGQLVEDDEIDHIGVEGPKPVAQQLFEGSFNVESGQYEVALFAEQLEVAKSYVISIETLTAELDGEVLTQWDNQTEEIFVQFDVVGEIPAEVSAEFICGEESVALSSHSAVSVETAEALAVNFANAPGIRYATYAIDRVLDEESCASVASGELSLNAVGYAQFDQPLVFVAGQQYVLTVKGWNTTYIFDENLNMAEPDVQEVILFNGASAMGIIGEPEWGLGLGEELAEDMINLGLPVRFPDMVLPFGVELEDCDITVSASLYGVPTGNEPMPIDLDDEVDPGMGVDGPVAIEEAKLHNVNVEGGIVTAMLFPEVMEAGNTYAIVLNAVTVISEGEIVAELPADAYYDIMFRVAEAENPVSIKGINVENAKVIYNLFGQQVKSAKGIVIVNGEKALVK